jgi:Xaa-Pro aminopeptidase
MADVEALCRRVIVIHHGRLLFDGDLARLVQRFSAVWDADAIATHRAASEKLYRVKDRAFEAIARRLRDGAPTTEYDIQQLMVAWFRDEALVSDSEPIVASSENCGNPHYQPTATAHRPIRPDELVLLDLWGKLDEPGAVFADITWIGFVGPRPPERSTARTSTESACADYLVGASSWLRWTRWSTRMAGAGST